MTKKRHHYIPQFYLKGFTDSKNEPYIWIYDKEHNGRIIKSTAKDIAVKKHYFTFMTQDQEKDSETVENLLAVIETEAAAVFRKIHAGETITDIDKSTFAVFVASMMLRVPNFRNNVQSSLSQVMKKLFIMMASNKEAFEKSVREYEQESGETFTMPIEKLRQIQLDQNKYDVIVDSQYALGMSLAMVKEMASILGAMEWTFLKATTEHKYICSDNPLFYCDLSNDPRSLYGVGLMSKNIEVTIPLSRDVAAFGNWKRGRGYIQANNAAVKDINRRTVSAALRFVFSPVKSDKLKEFVLKYKGSAPKIVVS